MTKIKISPKQKELLKVLDDYIHTEIFMGGAAGGSKSFTGCLWQILRRLKYDGSRGFLARARLKDLKASTLLTFFDVCRRLGLKMGIDYKYNSQEGVIKFFNGSEEYLKDLFYYPSDPEFTSLGSTEYTDGFIDEMGDVGEQAYQIMRSRIRYKLDEFGLIPKLAMGSNPCKTFIYREFYKRWRDNQLEKWKAYVPASVYDNPFISEHYIENLKKLDTINRERLLNGNWEYDDDPLKLFDYNKIQDLFTNEAKRGDRYAVVDQSGFGRDLFVITIWDGLYVIYEETRKEGISSDELDQMLKQWKVPRSNCVVDEGGVGFGLVKGVKGVIGFVANATPLKKKKETDEDKVVHNYKNLRSQCWFLLAKYVNSGLIGIGKCSTEFKNLLVEDLEQMKQVDADKDAPLRVISKDDLKKLGSLTRSTDVGDTLMMRMYFEINPNKGAWAIAGKEEEEESLKIYDNKEIEIRIINGEKVKFVNGRKLIE